MATVTTIFKRDALYAEVWADSVRTVAARYGISDVGLRKICVKLGVPFPPLGYWARLAAGKKVRVTALSPNHKGPNQYVRQMYVDEDADKRGERVAAFLAAHAPKSTTIPVEKALENRHAAVRRMAKRLGPRSRDHRGLLVASGGEVFEAAVSASHKDRGLRILDAALKGLLAAGATLSKPGKEGESLGLNLFGETVGLRIEEQVQRSARELTPAEKVKQAKEAFFYIRDPWTYQTTGKLTLKLLSDNEYRPFASVSDAKTTPLEARLQGLIERLWNKVTEQIVNREMQEEDSRRREAEWARHKARVGIRDKELAELKRTESVADEWRRATVLRGYAAAFEESRAKAEPNGIIAPKDVARIAWIRNAAEWLDPLRRAHWPAVDIGVAKDDEEPSDDDGRMPVSGSRKRKG